jgi:hypothetical protein
MKKKNLLVTVVFSLGLLLTSCGKNRSSNSGLKTTSGSSTVETTPVPNHKTKGLDLGVAKSFGVMAFVSITSAPTSSIAGKVGLKPGIRSLITLNPRTEVEGGSSEVYAGDDVGDPQNYITMAKQDLISAYREASTRTVDKDKVEAYAGNLAGKILPAGVYHWSNGASISSDVTLEGTDTDVWIFQIDGNLDVAANTRMNLSGGAQARNVYWEVSGKTTLGSNSITQGTVMNQLTFEMKSNAQIVGRVLCKNGKVLLNQNIITASEK